MKKQYFNRINLMTGLIAFGHGVPIYENNKKRYDFYPDKAYLFVDNVNITGRNY